jgi:hypothetical protein
VAAELLYESVCLQIRDGWYEELTGNTQGFPIDEF